MHNFHDYELLDFGAGRKLERFGDCILDRPSPAAAGQQKARPDRWRNAQARFELNPEQKGGPRRGHWEGATKPTAPWAINCGQLCIELKLTDFGHIGLFPEQMTCWEWIANEVQRLKLTERGGQSPSVLQPRVLNLFAYTGGSTLAAAAAAITHVDSARNIVDWARRNAELSSLAEAPIRWIVEDALKFVRREVRRGNSYDAVILDPPAYGHGPGGEIWKLDEHLPELLSLCRELTDARSGFVLLTSHAPDHTPRRLAECILEAGFTSEPAKIEAGELSLATTDRRHLSSGTYARTSF
jgi:23S rRNA (cytosine1962-C5)-methyltransferase